MVPANERWFRDYLVLRIVLRVMEKLELSYPQPNIEVQALLEKLREEHPSD
ncbi:hypothetical protein ABE504_09520 [Paenibacillus oryzisoli]